MVKAGVKKLLSKRKLRASKRKLSSKDMKELKEIAELIAWAEERRRALLKKKQEIDFGSDSDSSDDSDSESEGEGGEGGEGGEIEHQFSDSG